MATIMTKQGNLDNVVTYEHICDTFEDIQSIDPHYITLGSTCVVINGESGGLEVYMADSNKEWQSISISSESSGDIGIGIHICGNDEYDSTTGEPTIEEPIENQFYLVPSSGSDSSNLFDEWIYVNEAWEKFGSGSANVETVVSNWEQNDSSASDYIKGRFGGYINDDVFKYTSPFYTTTAQFQLVNYGSQGTINFTIPLSVNFASKFQFAYFAMEIDDKKYVFGNSYEELINNREVLEFSEGESIHPDNNIHITYFKDTGECSIYYVTTTIKENKEVNLKLYELFNPLMLIPYYYVEHPPVWGSGDSLVLNKINHNDAGYSIAANANTTVTNDGIAACAFGADTIANSYAQFVFGQFNIPDPRTNDSQRGTYIEIIGNGTMSNNRSNARTLDWNGNEWLAGNLTLNQTTLTENDLIQLLASRTTEISISDTDVIINANPNTRYVCGEVSTLSFTPSATGICDIKFTSGSSKTILTLPSTVKMPDWFEVEANTIYEISIADGIYGVVASWAV